MTERRELLQSSDLAQLGDLFFVARRLVEGLYAGRHASPQRGHSTEFYDYRSYVPGDSLARVDWKVFGRTDRLYVRRFRHDADLQVMLVVDRSRSMDFVALDTYGRSVPPTRELPSKWAYARQLAAAIAFLIVRQNDRVGLCWMDTDVEPVLPACGGFVHLQRLIEAMTTAECHGRTDPKQALRRVHSVLVGGRRRRGMVIVISDFLEPVDQWLSGFGPMLHDRMDLLCMQVLTAQELDLSGIGGVALKDLETRESVSTYAPAISKAYRRTMGGHCQSLHRALVGRGMDHLLLRTDESPMQGLREFVSRRYA